MKGTPFQLAARGSALVFGALACAVVASHAGATSSSSSSNDFVCNVWDLLPPTFTGCFGDVDGNGFVNPGDRGQVQANLGRTDDTSRCLYDLDNNGTINAGDRGYVAANMGRCMTLPAYQTEQAPPPPPDQCNANRAPVAHAGADRSGLAGEMFTFDGGASTDLDDGDQAELTYTWNFGDGSPTATSGPNNPDYSSQVDHAFALPGTFTVTLSVRDSCGDAALDTLQVVVTPPASDPTDPPVDPAGNGTCPSFVFEGPADAMNALVGRGPNHLIVEGNTVTLRAADYFPTADFPGANYLWVVRSACTNANGAAVACASPTAADASLFTYLGGQNDQNSVTPESLATDDESASPEWLRPNTNVAGDRGATVNFTFDHFDQSTQTQDQDIWLVASHPECGETAARVATMRVQPGGPLAATFKTYRLAGPGKAGCTGRWEEVDPATTTFELGERIKFSATPSRGNIAWYSWQFMDGTGAGTEEVVHAYDGDGTFNVQLTVYKANWQSSRVNRVVTVEGMELVSQAAQDGYHFSPWLSRRYGERLWILSTESHVGYLDLGQAYSLSDLTATVVEDNPSGAIHQLAVTQSLVCLSMGALGVSIHQNDAGFEELSRLAMPAVGIAAVGDYLYMVPTMEHTLLTYSLADPRHPSLVYEMDLPETYSNTLRLVGEDALVVWNEYADRMLVIDIRDRSTPLALADSADPIQSPDAAILSSSGSRLFVSAPNGLNVLTLQTMDAQEHEQLFTREVFPVDYSGDHVIIAGKRLFASSGTTVKKYDIADAQNPYLMQTFNPPGIAVGDIAFFDPDGLEGGEPGLILVGRDYNGYVGVRP